MQMGRRQPIVLLLYLMVFRAPVSCGEEEWVIYRGKSGPGLGKQVVLMAGDDEYRSEEGLPQLGKILAEHHGFTCTVLFPVDPATGEIKPDYQQHIPGLEALQDADLMIMGLRFRDLPDGQMKQIDQYLRSGRPVIGLRTSTHAFNIPADKSYAHYSNGYEGEKQEWKGGFGRLVLGEKWINHHGAHGQQSTGGVIPEDVRDHPVVRGIRERDIWGDTDVYGVRLPLPGDSRVMVLGQVLDGMTADAKPVPGEKNDPMMPVAWTKSYQIPGGQQGKVFATTMGAATDLLSEGTRRLLVNAVYWILDLADQIPPGGTRVELVGEYAPSSYSFGGYRKGMKPSAYRLEVTDHPVR